MSAGVDLRTDAESEPDASPRPRVSACRSSPETVVFLEADNTDGWIATDLAVELEP